jgi:hypothetical protein
MANENHGVMFHCPACLQTLRATMSVAGQPIRCPHCQQVVRLLDGQEVEAARMAKRLTKNPSEN